MQERIYAQINLTQLAANFNRIKKIIQPQTKVMGVVKADAYGHGVIPVAQKLIKLGVNCFGVASVKEGLELRRAKIKKPILILSEPLLTEAGQVIKHDLTPAVYSQEFVAALAKKLNKKNISIHIKVDTGMSRIGLLPAETVAFIEKIKQYKKIKIEGVFTHFACADQPSHPLNASQLAKFKTLVAEIKNKYPEIKLFHAANSAATFNLPEAHFDLVRVGIALYKDVLTLRARISWLKELHAGSSVSYGARYQTAKTTRLATISAGYADGYNRLLSDRGQVLLQGRKYPVVGTVCMDMFMVDVTGADTQRGEEVVLIGQSGQEKISAEDIAEKIGTIDYEVLCGISKRVPRIYIA